MLQTVIRPSIDRRADRLAHVFDDVSGAARGAGGADDRKGDVLGRDARAERAARPRPSCSSTCFWISVWVASTCSTSRRADAVRQGPEGAVGRGVAVAADDGHAGLGPALLRADDVHDALPDVVDAVVFDAEVRGVRSSATSTWMRLSSFSMPRARPVSVGTLWSGTATVFSGARTPAAGQAQALESLRARHLVDEVAVDVEQARFRPAPRAPGGRPRSCRRGFSDRP